MEPKKKLLMKLVFSKDENEVAQIIQNDPILNNQDNWRPYGKKSNNIGTVTGQSPEAVPSLVEKIINSIDAMLVKKCIQFGDDPKSPNSPKSMEGALKKYFNLDDEKYADLTNKARRKLSLNIQVITDGSKKNPNIVIYDNGEGQYPQDFSSTLVSLHENNKQSIFFVQGKYNMGGSAVLPFCGDRRYELILSKKNISGRDKETPYGFTVIRRNRGEGMNVKSSWYEYCVDEKGKIFEFDSKLLDLGLYSRKFKGGTFIKLFNYDLRNPSNITLDLWRDLNRNMYKTALPIMLFENRKIYKGHSPTKIMHGNRTRALLDDRDSVETVIPMTITSDNIKYPVEVFLFKKDVKQRDFIGSMPVVFSVNGQVQHKLDNSFISNNIKKAYLKGFLLINIDCSNMPRQLHEDIFMSSRSFMRDRAEFRNLVDSITKELKNNEVLKK